MLSGRRKRDYEAESLASQAAGDAEALTVPESQETGNADEAPEGASSDSDQVLVLA